MEPTVEYNRATGAYRERLEVLKEKLICLMAATDMILVGEASDENKDRLEERLGQLCYVMELMLFSQDLSPINIAMAQGIEAQGAASRFKHQPIALLSALYDRMKLPEDVV
jgi:hypothetical protein